MKIDRLFGYGAILASCTLLLVGVLVRDLRVIAISLSAVALSIWSNIDQGAFSNRVSRCLGSGSVLALHDSGHGASGNGGGDRHRRRPPDRVLPPDRARLDRPSDQPLA